MFDPMADLTSGGSITGDDDHSSEDMQPKRAAPQRSSGGDRRFAEEVHSVTIHARQRTFYIDLKESSNGKFFKMSEKSRGGQKTTIMFDAEDLEKIIAGLEEMKEFV